ncbi:MAG TPA: hypothetical protein VIL95_03525 [Bacillota bacterium]
MVDGTFADLVKRARFEDLCARLQPALNAEWDWPRLRALLGALGVDDPYGFLAAGWWLPAEARFDPEQFDRYADEAERAVAEGELPQAGENYTWEHVRRLLKRCRIEPREVVRGLVWAYANTPGEDVFIDIVQQHGSSG